MADIPPVEGVSELVGKLDHLARRRPQGDPRIPAVRCHGTGADALVKGYRGRLVGGDGRNAVPHVLIDCSKKDDIVFFDELAGGLSRAMPSGMGRLRLPTYWTLRHVLDTRTSQGGPDEQRDELGNALRDRHREFGNLVGWFDEVVRNQKGFWYLGGSAVVSGAKFLFKRRLRRGSRFHWFNEELQDVLGGGDHDFLDSALCLVANGPERSNRPLVDRVLSLALLRDLDAATRHSFVSPSRRRRVTPFFVHLVDVARRSSAQRFIDTHITADAGKVPRGTTVVLASVAWADQVSAHDGDAASVSSLHEAATELGRLSRPGRRSSLPEVLLVEVPSGPQSDQDKDWLERHRKVWATLPRGGRWRVGLVPVLFFLALPMLAAGTVWLGVALFNWLIQDPACPDIEKNDSGEAIGVGDGTASCSFFEGQTGPLVDAQREVEEIIAAENARVLADYQDDQTYRTIVFFAPLTLPDSEPESESQNALSQLRGAAAAQKEANDQARKDKNKVPMLVVLANPGNNFDDGERVARQVTKRAEGDSTIIGVIGIDQSRTTSRAAVGHFGDAGIPVVAGPVTGDNMIDASAHYYQVSARNLRVASLLVAFSTNADILETNNSEMVPATRAVIIKDHSDEYSQNLANDIYDEFVESGNTVIQSISYPVENDELPLKTRPGIPADSRARTLDEAADRVCREGEDEPYVLFYASRAQQLPGLLESLHKDPDCGDSLTVVAGTAITELASDPTVEGLDYEGLRLYYGAFSYATRESSDATSLEFHVDTQAARDFQRWYREDFGDDTSAALTDISDAALTYDAFAVLREAANDTKRRDLKVLDSDVSGTLSSGLIEFNGATGYIKFDSGEQDAKGRLPQNKPVFVLRANPDGEPELEVACGQFTKPGTSTEIVYRTWGDHDQFRCPDVN